MGERLLTPEPIVTLRNHFRSPTLDAIAAARTCYSSRIISPAEISEKERVAVGKTTYAGGHHTVYQHEMFEFEIENVSRAFAHDVLHSHPFYNSSQQSQRYVKLEVPKAVLPPFSSEANRRRYERTVFESWQKYLAISDILFEDIAAMRGLETLQGPARRKMAREIRERAMEAARYDTCIAVHTSLIHTIDGVTLWRLSRLKSLSWEASAVITKMEEEVRKVDPHFLENPGSEEPLRREDMPEFRIRGKLVRSAEVKRFSEEFDAELGGLRSKLVDYTPNAETTIADAVRFVLALPRTAMTDQEALQCALDPYKNPYLLETLNLTMMAPILKSLAAAQYTFRKKLSHAADSQNQRHRTIPAARPLTMFLDTRKPDYVTPEIIERNSTARSVHAEWMKELWEAKNGLVEDGEAVEYVSYLLPQAVALRIQETGSLMHLWYKLMNRSCLRAQEEIWRIAMEEIAQIRRVHPGIGEKLGPPCYIRKMAYQNELLAEEQGRIKYCNQGKLYCRQPVWNFYPSVTMENILRV